MAAGRSTRALAATEKRWCMLKRADLEMMSSRGFGKFFTVSRTFLRLRYGGRQFMPVSLFVATKAREVRGRYLSHGVTVALVQSCPMYHSLFRVHPRDLVFPILIPLTSVSTLTP